MGFRYVQKSMTLNGQNAYVATDNQKVFRMQRLAHVSFTNLLAAFSRTLQMHCEVHFIMS